MDRYHLLLLPLLACLTMGLGYGVLSLPDQAEGLQKIVAGKMEVSGVSNPVTAVLLNFRGYDTLLEMVVLFLALRQSRRRGIQDTAAPRGLQQQVLHVWWHDGEVVDRIPLEITGGGPENGYRAWSHKLALGDDPTGRWRVTVITDDGQLIGARRFTVE